MEKRIILAFILSFAVLYAFRAFFSPPAPTSVPPSSGQPPEAATANTSIEAENPIVPSRLDQNIRAEKSEDLVVDTPLYTATVSNIGGVLKSYKLKAYSDAEGHPIELIDENAGNKLGWPLAMTTGDTALDETLAKAIFVVRRERNRISMEFAADGVAAQKILQFDPEHYEFSLAASLARDGKSVSRAVVWQGGFGDQSITPDPTKRNAVYEAEAAFKTIGLRSIKEAQEFTVARAGVEDQYFLAMFLLPANPIPVKVGKQEFTGPDGKAVAELQVSVQILDSKPIRVYVGPKDRRWLDATDPRLASVISYGWFEFIARPLLFCLLLIHSYVGNFGWSIILLTLAINFLLFPLRLKQQVSMQQMQKIQPQMKTLQDKYKKLKPADPKRAQLQTEMMQLYKEHGVNPMGGCLPLLLQMPVFFGLYSMLSVSIELRGAPWIFWIRDLSQPEHLFIPVLPVLMAVSMIIQQKMTPTTVDPAQAKMMMIMPLMFLFMFLWVQSGLTLYWLTSNMVGIGQQFFINKYWSPRADSKVRDRSKAKEPRDK
jgi:YidC/Oxa1 family membrane protein insertase